MAEFPGVKGSSSQTPGCERWLGELWSGGATPTHPFGMGAAGTQAWSWDTKQNVPGCFIRFTLYDLAMLSQT